MISSHYGPNVVLGVVNKAPGPGTRILGIQLSLRLLIPCEFSHLPPTLHTPPIGPKICRNSKRFGTIHVAIGVVVI